MTVRIQYRQGLGFGMTRHISAGKVGREHVAYCVAGPCGHINACIQPPGSQSSTIQPNLLAPSARPCAMTQPKIPFPDFPLEELRARSEPLK